MAETSTKLTPAEHLEKRIRENREWAEKWRAENGDPGEAIGRLLVERFGIEALRATYEEYRRNRYDFMYDDEPGDEEDEDLDGRESG